MDDVAEALGYEHTPHMVRMIDDDLKGVHNVDTTLDKIKARKIQTMTVISEAGVYHAILNNQRENWKLNGTITYPVLDRLSVYPPGLEKALLIKQAMQFQTGKVRFCKPQSLQFVSICQLL